VPVFRRLRALQPDGGSTDIKRTVKELFD
jgi:hypothetical protein